MTTTKTSTKLGGALLVGILAICTMGASCNESIIRDQVVYETELNFFEKAAMDQAALLEGWVKESCTCSEGEFSSKQCRESAEAVVVVRARIPWHKAMSRYNAGIDDTAPEAEPPAVPDARTLCPGGNDAGGTP